MAKKPSPAPGVDQATAAPAAANVSAGPAPVVQPDASTNDATKEPAQPELQSQTSSSDEDQPGAGDTGSQLGAASEAGDQGDGEGSGDASLKSSDVPGADALPQSSGDLVKAFALIGEHAPDGVRFDFSRRPEAGVLDLLESVAPAMQALLETISPPVTKLLAAFLSPSRATFVTDDGRKHTVQRP